MSNDLAGELQGLGVQFGGADSIASLMSDPDGISEMLQNEHPQTGESAADIFADIVNTSRADLRKLAEAHDVDVSAPMMQPDRAAQLLAGTIQGDGVELVVMFNELAAMRDEVLQEVLDEDEYQRYLDQKHAIMFTEPGGDE